MPTEPTGVAPKGKGAGAWLKTHRVEAGAGVVGAVVVLALVKKKSAASTSAAAGQPAGTSAGTSPVATVFPATPSQDWWNQNNSQPAVTTPAQPTAYNPAVGPLAGSGYGPVPPGTTAMDAQGNTYDEVQSVATEEAWTQGGGTLFYEGAPGLFQPDTGQVAPGTPLYIEQGAPA